MTPYELAQVAVKALDARRAKEIRMLKTTDVTTLADYFVICSGTSNTQIKALTESVEEAMKNAGEMPDHIEGHREGTIMAVWSFTSFRPKRGSFTTWNVCGATRKRSIFPVL